MNLDKNDITPVKEPVEDATYDDLDLIDEDSEKIIIVDSKSV